MQRFFVSPEDIRGNEIVLRKQAHQIRDVLRLKSGEHIIVLDNEGFEYETALTEITGKEIKGRIVEKRKVKDRPRVKITLYQSMPAREKLEWLLQKCTEVGVAGFVPVITERSIVRDCKIKASKMDRWRQIVQEAAEQSQRGRMPEVSPPVTFEKAIEEIDGYGCKLIASPAAESSNLRDCLKGFNCGEAALFVGPEGGFTKDEVKLCIEKGARAFSLGKQILRTETAAVVASALILYELGQME